MFNVRPASVTVAKSKPLNTHTHTQTVEVSSSNSSKLEDWITVSGRKQHHNAWTQIEHI